MDTAAAVEQRTAALERSREIRVARGRILKSLRTGRMKLAEVDLDADCLQTIRVVDLLGDMRWNRGRPTTRGERKRKAGPKARALCAELGIEPGVTLGQLGAEQKRELIILVERIVPAQQTDDPFAYLHRSDEHPRDTFSHPNESAILLAEWPYDA